MNETKPEPLTYVGLHPVCGHVRAAVLDLPGHEKETAKDVASFMRSGLKIERWETRRVREGCWWWSAPRVPTSVFFDGVQRCRV